MIIDHNLEMATAQALTASAASEDDLDSLKAGAAMDGSELWLVARAGTALTSSGGGATLKVGLRTSAADNFSPEVEIAAFTVLEAACTANTILGAIKVPPGLLRYVRGYFTVTGENFTGGTIDLFLVPNIDKLFV